MNWNVFYLAKTVKKYLLPYSLSNFYDDFPIPLRDNFLFHLFIPHVHCVLSCVTSTLYIKVISLRFFLSQREIPRHQVLQHVMWTSNIRSSNGRILCRLAYSVSDVYLSATITITRIHVRIVWCYICKRVCILYIYIYNPLQRSVYRSFNTLMVFAVYMLWVKARCIW